MSRFAQEGYSLIVLKLVCPSGETAELIENVQRVGEEIIPGVAGLEAAGGWLPM